jgi:hypothetical protein
MASEQGYSNQKKKGKAQFKTIHPVNSNGYSESVIPKYLADKTPGSNCAVDSVTEIFNNNGQIEFWEILFDQTVDAVAGDVIRFKIVSDQKLFNFEFDVIEVISSDTLRVLPISDIVPAIGDTIQLLRFVTAASDDSGNPQIAIAPAPIKFLLDGVTTDVSKDTVTPANSKLLPTENLTAQASLSSIDGKFTTLNAKDFATSAKQDTGNSFLSSIDGKFTTLNAKDFATSAKQDTGNSSLSSIDGKFTTLNAVDFATAAKQDTGNSSLSSIDGKFTTLNAKDFATSAKQDTGNSSLSSIDGKLQNNGLLDSGNSSVIPLGANAVFTGVWKDIINYNAIALGVNANQDSANNGLVVQYSHDGVSIDHTHIYSVAAGLGIGLNLVSEFRYFRIVYTNGAIAQTSFVLQSILKTNPLFPSQYRLTNPLTDDTQATVSRSLIFGKTTGGGGGYVDVKVNPSGALVADVSGTVSVTGVSTLAEQQTQTTAIGSLTETAPATDTASSGLNGRLQRIAQRITSLIALIPASLGQKSMANSFAVALASDQSALSTTQTALVSSYQEITDLTITAQTFTAPVGAKWCKIYAEDTNVANIRVRIGGTATVTSGLQLQPGRSEDFNAVGNISVIAESGTNQKVNVHFGV